MIALAGCARRRGQRSWRGADARRRPELLGEVAEAPALAARADEVVDQVGLGGGAGREGRGDLRQRRARDRRLDGSVRRRRPRRRVTGGCAPSARAATGARACSAGAPQRWRSRRARSSPASSRPPCHGWPTGPQKLAVALGQLLAGGTAASSSSAASSAKSAAPGRALAGDQPPQHAHGDRSSSAPGARSGVRAVAVASRPTSERRHEQRAHQLEAVASRRALGVPRRPHLGQRRRRAVGLAAPLRPVRQLAERAGHRRPLKPSISNSASRCSWTSASSAAQRGERGRA